MNKIRKANLSDIPILKELYQNTILTVNRKDYTAEEVEDWASCGDDTAHLAGLLEEQHYVVAENEKGVMVGFASVNDTGYMHALFVHKDFQHQGIATSLYKYLEAYAKERGAKKLTSEVSVTAKPFFEKQGFQVDEAQQRKANQLYLTNYKMSKPLFKPLSEMTNEELWQLFPIVLSKHQGRWKDDFETECENIQSSVDNIVKITHIGSTAVPKLLAKPTIDILVEVAENTDCERLIQQMKSIEFIYEPQPDNLPPHMMFMKGYTPQGFKPPVYHVHVRYLGDWDEIHFRDYLIAHPEAAKEYGKLKLILKERFEHDRDGYTDAKTEFVQKIMNLIKLEQIS